MQVPYRSVKHRQVLTGALVRVAVAVLLALAAVGPASVAWAQGGPGGAGGAAGGGGNGSGGASAGPGGAESARPSGPGGPGSEPERVAPPVDTVPTGIASVLVVQVRFAAGGIVVVDGGALDSVSAWAPYLAPGMWVRAEGTWQGAAFQARSLAITSPSAFCYYRGPASALDGGQGWAEAWFAADPNGSANAAGDSLLARRPMPPTDVAVWLGNWAHGTWVGAPNGIAPPAPPGDGWWLLQGAPVSAAAAGATAIRWGGATSFPPP